MGRAGRILWEPRSMRDERTTRRVNRRPQHRQPLRATFSRGLDEFRTSSFRRANFQPVAGLRSRPVGKTACHCGDWKAPPCPIVIGSVSPLRSSISNSGASWGETPLSPVRSMLSSSQRMAVRVHRRETLGWPVLLSLALHLTLFLSLLIIPPTQPPTSASEPLTVDVIVGEGPAEATSEPPAPTEAPAAPIAPPPPVQQAEIPTPAPDVPPPPPVQQAETPPPTPVQQARYRHPHRTCRRPHRFSKLRYRHQRRHPHQCLFRRHPRRWRRCTRRGRRHSVPPPALRSTRRGRLRTRRPGRMPRAARAMRTMAPPGWGS